MKLLGINQNIMNKIELDYNLLRLLETNQEFIYFLLKKKNSFENLYLILTARERIFELLKIFIKN